MMPEKWKNIVGNIKDKFEVLEQRNDHLDEDGGMDIESIIFIGPLGKMKLDFIIRPAILDKKTKYSNRIGSQTAVEYIYSQEEKSYKLKVYKWEEAQDDWLEMEAKNFNL